MFLLLFLFCFQGCKYKEIPKYTGFVCFLWSKNTFCRCLVDDRNAAHHLARSRAYAYRIKSIVPIRNIDYQCVVITFRFMHQLSEHVVDLYLGHAFSLDFQAMIGRIGEDAHLEGFVFSHIGGRIIHLQVEKMCLKNYRSLIS